jgi:HlyD family secretion protein
MKLWNDDQKANQALAEAQRAMAAQRVKEACTTAASSAREAERQASLKKKGFVSDAREDQARSDADARAAACETAKADVAQAAARVSVTKVEQGRMVLYAPFDGTVAKIVGELGEYSTPSPPGVPTPPAIDLIDETCLYVKAPMDEVDAPKIKAGLPVRVSLDALPKQPLPGKVQARRALCARRWRSRRARSMSRSTIEQPGGCRQAAGRLQRRRRDRPLRAARTCCACRPLP